MQDVRFYEKDVFNKDKKEETIFKTVFDKKAKNLPLKQSVSTSYLVPVYRLI